jgi:hypothetical protein
MVNLKKILICVFIAAVAAGFQTMPFSAATQASGLRVSGWLANVEGLPFNDPNSRAVLRLGNGVAGVSRIGGDGFFEFTNVLSGNYSLSLSGTGFAISPVIPVRVESTDVRNLDMTVSRFKQVSGQVTLDGNRSGPLPQVRLLLKPLRDPAANPAVKALSPSGFVTNDAFPGLVPVIPLVDLNPKSDGTFVAKIPDGEWSVAVSGELPAGYALKALTYGGLDILHNPIKVRLSDYYAIRLDLSYSPNRLSNVYGRLTGLTPAMIASGPMSVSLRGPMNQTGPGRGGNTQSRTAAVRTDGTFEIDEVLPGDYFAMVTGLGQLDLAVARLSVPSADNRDFEIEIRRVEVRGQVVVDGGGPMVPDLRLSFRTVREPGAVVAGGDVHSVEIRPLRDGTFTAFFPAEEQLLNTGYGGSCGYQLKSLIYGATDVLKSPLKGLRSNASPLQITLTYSECLKRQ